MSLLREKSFLDTNIFVYTFDSDAPRKRARAREIVAQSLQDRLGVISYQVVQEFLNVATRKFAHSMSISEARLYLDQVLMPLCETFPNGALYARSLSISDGTGISFYDALIVGDASAARCSVLLTEDLQHGQRIGELQIRNPFL